MSTPFRLPSPLRGRHDRVVARGSLIGAALALATGSAWFVLASGERPLHAQGVANVDTDGDGLPDELEIVLGTEPDDVDTDADGVSDAEEVARRSSPTSSAAVPTQNVLPRISMSMDAFASGVDVHALTTIYFPHGYTRSHTIQYKAVIGGRLVSISTGALRGGAPPRTIELGSGAQLLIVDPVVQEQRVFSNGGFALAAVVSEHGTGLAAAAANLATAGVDIFQSLITGYQSPVPDPDLTVGLGVGSVYRPIRTGGGSSNYTAGEICAQTTVIVGVVGALITQEVISAGCVTGWDAFCTPGCAASVGSTLKTIDPATLIGG